MEAIQGLTQFDQDGVAQRIIDRYLQLYPHERPQAIMALVSRPRFAADLLAPPSKPARFPRPISDPPPRVRCVLSITPSSTPS
jgi:hypothetical protein